MCTSACLLVFLAAATAEAQYRPRRTADPATGESYRVEFATALWNPTPAILISSEALGIGGTDIDFVTDFGIVKKRFPELRLVLRPGQKHKFRLHYIPISYTSDTVVQREFVFNGQRYRVGLPLASQLEWKAWRFGYEYDFLYRDRGFAGLVLEAKYTDVTVSLESVIGTEFASAKAPIPAIGGIGRVYVMPNISITGELTGFKLPERIDEKYRARYLDFDLYGTLNFTENLGVQVGYRSIDLFYRVDRDRGNLNMKGLYFTGLVRY